MTTLCALNLLPKYALKSDGIGCEFRDTFPKLLDSHCLLIEIESEERLIVDVALLWDVEVLCVACNQLLGNLVGGVVQLLEVIGL